MDNANLQELFLWNKTRKLVIEKGKVFFHINPLLCVKEIEKLLKVNGLAEVTVLRDLEKFDTYDVNPLSNGDKTACHLVNLDLRVQKVSHKMAMFNWVNYRKGLDDPRELLGYLIYYKKATGNVSMFDGRDACTDTEWSVVDFEASEGSKISNGTDLIRSESAREMTIVTGLDPATRYAIYTKTYTVSSASKGGLSDIVYFTTDPYKPHQPTDVIITAPSSSTIMIKWKPPKKPNGKIVKYIVQGIQDLTNIEAYRSVDHCYDKPIMLPSSSKSSLQNETSRRNASDSFIQTILPRNQTVDGVNCCACKKIAVNAADEADDLIAFEDALHNRVYVKQSPQETPQASALTRSKRSISMDNKHQGITEPSVISSSTDVSTNISVESPVPDSFYYEVNASDGENILTVDGRIHYAQYSIQIIACQKRENESTHVYLERKCSLANENTINTQPESEFTICLSTDPSIDFFDRGCRQHNKRECVWSNEWFSVCECRILE